MSFYAMIFDFDRCLRDLQQKAVSRKELKGKKNASVSFVLYHSSEFNIDRFRRNNGKKGIFEDAWDRNLKFFRSFSQVVVCRRLKLMMKTRLDDRRPHMQMTAAFKSRVDSDFTRKKLHDDDNGIKTNNIFISRLKCHAHPLNLGESRRRDVKREKEIKSLSIISFRLLSVSRCKRNKLLVNCQLAASRWRFEAEREISL